VNERLILDALDGREEVVEELERDAEARAAFAEDLGLQHRLRALLGKDAPDLATAVVRELRFENDGARFAADVLGRLRPSRRLSLILPLAAAAGFLLLVGALLYRPSERPAAASRGRALLVVGRLPLTSVDRAARARMEALGFEVSPVSGAALTRDEAGSAALIALSSSAHAEDPGVGELLRDLPVPLVVWEPRLFHPLGLVSGDKDGEHWGAGQGPGRLRVLDPAHPLAAGFSGVVHVAGDEGRVSWGRVPPGAIRVAVRDGEEERSAIFAFESGAPRADGGRAPARRVGLFLFESSFPTSDGWRLFEAAVSWAREGTGR
jgi:hypothetical protein